MTDMTEALKNIIGAVVEAIGKEEPDGPDIHLFLNKEKNRITITVDYAVETDIATIGPKLLDAVEGIIKAPKAP